jgi:sugar (pentulose or hexulose) kinase
MLPKFYCSKVQPVISRGTAEIDVSHLPNGHVECDPLLLWKSIVDSVGQALATREAKGVPISAVSWQIKEIVSMSGS